MTLEEKLKERFPKYNFEVTSISRQIAFQNGLVDRIALKIDGIEYAVVGTYPMKDSTFLDYTAKRIDSIERAQ